MSKFKVGDTVRVTKEHAARDRAYVGKVAKLIKFYDGAWLLEGVDIYMIDNQLELVKASLTKADMQIGQIYKTRTEEVWVWCEDDIADYMDDLRYSPRRDHDFDIIEVYPMEITPIWKRPEPKYRVKTELTKDQAEKLGMELCEEVKDGTL